MNQKTRTPVMADVARLAGVSHQTVSRVINGQNNLRPATRERVEEAIRQLGYRPNFAARQLAGRRSGTIGVIGNKSGFWGPNTIHRSVQSFGRAAGYFVSSASLQSLARSELLDAIDHLRDQSVEGIVLIAAHDEAIELVRANDSWGLPVVIVEGDGARSQLTVGVDQVAGGYAATRHLVDLGHTEIAHLAGPQDWAEARGRQAGWQQAMDEAELRRPSVLPGDWSARSGYQAGLLLPDPITAVFCANDQMAVGLLRAVTEAGRRVPEDLSVVGFDDIPEAEYLRPPLTTVRQEFDRVGQLAIDILKTAIAADSTVPTPERLLSPELVVRASTASPGEKS